MSVLDQLFGKDVATLIYRKVYEMLLTNMLREYNECVYQAYGTSALAGIICVKWGKLPKYNRKWYNWRNSSVKNIIHVSNKYLKCVAEAYY